MKKSARSRAGHQEESSQLAFAAMIDAKATLHDAVVRAGLSVLASMLEEERTRLCGPRYLHAPDRSASRGGHADGELAMGGRRVRVRRPRVRSVEGTEVQLETWERFAASDPLTPRAVEQMVLGVSTRSYARSLESTPPGVVTRGTSRSAVSRRFVAATRERLAEMMSRDLSELSSCVVMIDGIHLGEHVVLVALGIDERGNKQVLGLYEGSTENTTTCKSMLSDLVARGLCAERTKLFVVDGSKALSKAIRAVYGKCALVQRCQVHKRRNVLGHLPEAARGAVGRTISAAYTSTNPARARRMLEGLARQLERKHPSAAASLREGLDETLTVMGFGLSPRLARTLSTTNPIEFINSRIRRTTHNVTKWEGGEMVLRWVALALDEAGKTFRKLRGHKDMPTLVAALRAHDALLTPASIDRAVRAA